MNKNCIEILETLSARAIDGQGATRDEAAYLASPECCVDELLRHAERVREAHFKKEISFCGIVNARSGACSSDCRYCAQSVHASANAPLHPLLSPERIFEAAKTLAAGGVSCFGIISSGPAATSEEVRGVAEAVRSIKKETQLEVSASLGMQNIENLKLLKDAGIDRYHHNLETSRRFFPQICTTHTWDARLATLERAKSVGIELCSGGLFGMGESWIDRIDLALQLRELDVKSIPINFLMPFAGTGMEGRQPMQAEEALRLVAVFRFILPQATLRICGGRVTTLGNRQAEVFRAGANALMTGNYLTSAGMDPQSDLRLAEASGLSVAGASRGYESRLKMKINERVVSLQAGITLAEARRQYKSNADVVVLNGFPVEADKWDEIKLAESDEVVLIRKGERPQPEELAALTSARHTPGVAEKLRQAKVGIAGAGGLGSNVAYALARIGVGRLVIADFDVVEPSNLNRQAYRVEQIGQRKAETLVADLAGVNPLVHLVADSRKLTADNIPLIFKDCQVVVECFDKPDQKAMLVETVLEKMPQVKVVAASGLAGTGDGNLIKVQRKNSRLWLVGDDESAATFGRGLMSPRVFIAAGQQANVVVRILLGEEE